eukprot:5670595-Pyramimonas_sp.AAC.1
MEVYRLSSPCLTPLNGARRSYLAHAPEERIGPPISAHPSHASWPHVGTSTEGPSGSVHMRLPP